MKTVITCLAAALLLGGSAAAALGADETPRTAGNSKILVAKAFRTSALTGLNVRNMQGEKLGTVNDLVVDISTGKISYVALSVGGVLGVGDKLFAVPYSEMKFDHGTDEMFFVLDMSKEKLEAAPGFNQADWPDFADPHWSDQIDKYYRESRPKEVRTQEKTSTVD
ncbi:MAG: PRC-barrel domain-containing protein [Pirellulales bacterium]